MSIIHTVLTTAQLKRLSKQDNGYLRRKMETNSALNNLLQRPLNKPLLTELQNVLDNKSVTRRRAAQHSRNSKVRVYNADGKLIMIEHANGKVMKEV